MVLAGSHITFLFPKCIHISQLICEIPRSDRRGKSDTEKLSDSSRDNRVNAGRGKSRARTSQSNALFQQYHKVQTGWGRVKVKVISGLLREGTSSAVYPWKEVGQAPGGKGLAAPAFRACSSSDGGGPATRPGILPVDTLCAELLQASAKVPQCKQESLVLVLHLRLGERRSMQASDQRTGHVPGRHPLHCLIGDKPTASQMPCFHRSLRFFKQITCLLRISPQFQIPAGLWGLCDFRTGGRAPDFRPWQLVLLICSLSCAE